MAQFRYRKSGNGPEGWSGYGEGRRSYLADAANPRVIWKFLCVMEGLPGDWKVHGVGPRDPEKPKRRFMGPYRTRDEAAQAYYDAYETECGPD